MPVGHSGSMSSHPAWVKIILLELIRERLLDAAADLGIPASKIEVYDPFTTEMDFYLWLNVSWEDYLRIYSRYYSDDLKAREMDQKDRVVQMYANNSYLETALDVLKGLDKTQQIFNASTSRSTIFYTIDQMKRILKTGSPD